jgi:hypothetical protein
MKSGPVRDDQQTKQCAYNIPCDCGRCYMGEASRPLEIDFKGTNVSWPNVCLKNQNWLNMRMKKTIKYVGKKRKYCRSNQTP